MVSLLFHCGEWPDFLVASPAWSAPLANHQVIKWSAGHRPSGHLLFQSIVLCVAADEC